MIRTLKIYFLTNFKYIRLLTIVTTLYITSLVLIYLLNRNVYLLTTFTQFPHPLSCATTNLTVTLTLFWYVFFFFQIPCISPILEMRKWKHSSRFTKNKQTDKPQMANIGSEPRKSASSFTTCMKTFLRGNPRDLVSPSRGHVSFLNTQGYHWNRSSLTAPMGSLLGSGFRT